MTEVELVLPGRLASDDEVALETAIGLLEADTLASRFTRVLGGHVDAVRRLVPARVQQMVAYAVENALKAALRVSLKTLRAGDRGAPSSDRWHKTAAAASGALGGAFGIVALPVELPVSTAILLRSIAEIARAEGEDLTDPAVGLACLEVFALGGDTGEQEAGVESGYLASRTLLAQSITESARFLLRSGIGTGAPPVMVKLLSQIGSRFGVAVSEKVVAQSAPILGAVGGAAINAAFADHFQALARGHFIVRRLERRYGADLVREEYRRVRDARRGSNGNTARREFSTEAIF